MTATALLCAVSLASLPAVWPLYGDVAVRQAAPKAVAMLRDRGLWVVHATLTGIERHDGTICFIWEHRYRARARTAAPETIRTCIPPSA